MKKAVLIIFVAFIAAGCGNTGKIMVKNDNFKDAVTVSLNYVHKSIETLGFMSYRAEVNYYREIKESKKTPVEMTFRIRAAENAQDLNNNIFLKVNKNKYDIKMSDIRSESKSKTDFSTSSKTSSSGGTGSGYVDYTGAGAGSSSKGETTTTLETTTTTLLWKELSGKIVLNDKIENEILKSAKFTLRLYSGDQPFTFIIEKRKLEKIKKFLAVNKAPVK